MYGATAPSGSLSSVPRQSKVVSQRLYREKEGECFHALRDAIIELTGEELRTRKEVLQKATGLLLAASNIRKLREIQETVHPMPYETRALTAEDAMTGHIGRSAQPSHWPQNWHYGAEFDAQSAYCVPESHGQHHMLFSSVDSARNPTSPRGYAEDGFAYHYF